MTAYVISKIAVRNADKLKDYAQAAGETLKNFGARPIVRGRFAKTLLGTADARNIGVLEFPDLQAAEDWFASEDYQALSGLREEAGDMQFIAYEAPEA